MATQKTSRAYPDGGFDVTALIGHVSFSAMGDMNPVEAAFRLIGQHGAAGTYQFPHEDGGFWLIDVQRTVNDQPVDEDY